MDPLLYPPVVLAPFLFTLLLLSMPIVKKSKDGLFYFADA